MTGQELMAANPYRPWPARITSITELTATEKLFEFRLIDERVREAFHHAPSQFVELSLFGVGEAPISISSSPTSTAPASRASSALSPLSNSRTRTVVPVPGGSSMAPRTCLSA